MARIYDAVTVKIDRKTSTVATIFIKHAFVALAGGVQPGVLAELLNDDDVDAGQFARI